MATKRDECRATATELGGRVAVRGDFGSDAPRLEPASDRAAENRAGFGVEAAAVDHAHHADPRLDRAIEPRFEHAKRLGARHAVEIDLESDPQRARRELAEGPPAEVGSEALRVLLDVAFGKEARERSRLAPARPPCAHARRRLSGGGGHALGAAERSDSGHRALEGFAVFGAAVAARVQDPALPTSASIARRVSVLEGSESSAETDTQRCRS